MYAINHAATSLLLKKNEASVPIVPLLISTQFIEVLWVISNYLAWNIIPLQQGEFISIIFLIPIQYFPQY